MVVGEERGRVDAPIIVENASTADNYQIRCANGAHHTENIGPQNRLNAEGFRGSLWRRGCGCNQQIRAFFSQVGHHRRQNGFVTRITESEASCDEDVLCQ